MINYLDISYLAQVNCRQRFAHRVLCENLILEVLEDYSPIVVGTIPIDIDIASSDVDIICEVSDFKTFHILMESNFSRFVSYNYEFDELKYVVNFSIEGLVLEIYAEDKPTPKQHAYLHMIIEERLLRILGKDFKKRIVELKLQGYKTEPAFGILLSLDNPYTEMFDLINLTDEELFIKFSTFHF